MLINIYYYSNKHTNTSTLTLSPTVKIGGENHEEEDHHAGPGSRRCCDDDWLRWHGAAVREGQLGRRFQVRRGVQSLPAAEQRPLGLAAEPAARQLQLPATEAGRSRRRERRGVEQPTKGPRTKVRGPFSFLC